MPSIKITVTGLTEKIGAINQAIANLPTVKQQVLDDTAQFFVSELQRNAHVWTGKRYPPSKPHMRDTVRSQRFTENSIIVEVSANYAVYENARGGFKVGAGPHNFADRAKQATLDRFSSIIVSAYGNMFSSL